MIYVVDTHPLVWFLEANKRLSKRARSILLQADTELVIPAIVLAESKFLFAKKRIGLDLSTIYDRLLKVRNCTVYPLDEAVIAKMPTELEMHDGMIIATGLVIQEALDEEVVVITRDEAMAGAGLIRTLW